MAPYILALILVAQSVTAVLSVLLYVRVSRNSQKFQEIRDILHQQRAADRSDALAVTAATLDFRLRPRVREALRDLRAAKSPSPDPLGYSFGQIVDAIQPVFKLKTGAAHTIVCSVALGDAYRDIVAPCLESQVSYARRHGYDYCVLDDVPPHAARPAAWMKIPLIVKLLARGYRHVMYIDADAMVSNPDAGIDRQISELDASGACLLLTEDGACANSGVMFVRNCAAAKALLDLVWSYDADIHQGTWEQYALNFLMENFAEVRRNILIEPDPKTFNSFPKERTRFHPTKKQNIWSEGDFVCHFSGIRPPHLRDLIETYVQNLRDS